MGLSSALYYFFSFVMNQLTPLIVGSSLQLHGFFYIVSGFNLFGLFLILFFLPETKVSLGTLIVLLLDLSGLRMWSGDIQYTVGVKLKFPFCFRSTKPKWYTVLTKNSYKTDKHL